MGLGESIRDHVADVGVQTGDINSAAVTTAKLGVDTGKWLTGSWISGTTTVLSAGTAAFTVLEVYIQVTAADSGLVTLKTGSTAIFGCSTTAAFVCSSHGVALAAAAAVLIATASNTSIQDVAAGGDLVITASNSTAGKYYIHYIATAT